MKVRYLVSMVVALVGALALAGASAGVAGASEGCPNEARRSEQSSTYLPDCRAYELVSPAVKDSGEPDTVVRDFEEPPLFRSVRGARAAVDGDRLGWVSEYFLPGSEYSISGLASASTPGLDYLSTRGSGGWSSEPTVPSQSPEVGLGCVYFPGIVGWSSNLTKGILADGDAQESGKGSFYQQGFDCGHAEPALTEPDGVAIAEPEGFQNLFVREGGGRGYRLVNVTPSDAPHPTPIEGLQPYEPASYLAASAHLGHVAFEDELPLTAEAEQLSPAVEAACEEEPKGRACWEGHDSLYVWSEGQQPAVRLVSILPDGKPAEGMLAGSTRNHAHARHAEFPGNVADARHAVSANGARIFFEAQGDLYVRENGGQPQSALVGGECTEPAKACTIQLDLPQGGRGAGGGGKWLGASAAGTKVFFIDQASAGLTGTTVEGSGANLYEYELPSEQDTAGTLVDLTEEAAKAEVLGVSGIGEDGSYVYFVADAALPNTGDNSEGAAAQSKQPNLYVAHGGQVTFIATLNAQDECDWTSDTGCRVRGAQPLKASSTARVSGSGRYLAFDSLAKQTLQPTEGPACVGVYDKNGKLTGWTSGACEEIYIYDAEANDLACVSCNPVGVPTAEGATINVPANADSNEEQRSDYPQRNVSESGQVFFETREALLPQQDTNGVRDVYEYDHGALRLISSGTSIAPSFFMDASASGSDVFFATAQKLERWDTDSVYDIYDARVGGGFPEPPVAASPCEGDGCKGAAVGTAVFNAPGSATFAGPGNSTAAPAKRGGGKGKSRRLSRRQKLHRALRACRRLHRHDRHRRRECRRHARRRFAGKAKSRRHRRRRGRRRQGHRGGRARHSRYGGARR